MRNRALWVTIGVLAIIFLLVADVSAQSTQKIYGYVRVDGNLTNGVTVNLSGGGISGQPTAVTRNDGSGKLGYYEIIINGSGTSRGFTVSASYNNRSGSHSFIMPATGDYQVDLSLTASPTPVPTPTPTPTPTPRPSGELGGLVVRNDSSSFLPAAAHNPSATPIPKVSKTPSASPTAEPAPTAAPAGGMFSNLYLWLAIAIVAILVIAAAILVYLRK